MSKIQIISTALCIIKKGTSSNMGMVESTNLKWFPTTLVNYLYK